MKKIIEQNLLTILSFVVLVFGTSLFFGQDNIAIASCCEGELGRCTGSSRCTACTNCSRCKHCNSGGSCGVCSGGSRRTNNYYPSSSTRSTSSSNSKIKSYSPSKTNSLYTSEIYYLPNDSYSEYYLKTLIINTLALNLRKGPGTNYEILERLSKYQELVFLAMTDDWVKVRVKSTNTIGFVHYKYIVVLTE